MDNKIRIFYSWQSDILSKLNRALIESAIKKAVSNISDSTEPKLSIEIDQDARDKSGSPDLASELFRKIRNADIFIGDVSIVGQIGRKDKPRHVPNPNVMIEHGYALSKHGQERVLAICNSWHGTPEDLPFDIRHRRVIQYRATSREKNLEQIQENLSGQIERELRPIIATITTQQTEEGSFSKLLDKLQKYIDSGASGYESTLRQFWKGYFESITSISEKHHDKPAVYENFIGAIEKCSESQKKLYEIFSRIAELDRVEMGLLIVKQFGSFVENFSLRKTGSSYRTDYDVFKFIGYETIVALISFFLKYQKWDSLRLLMRETYVVRGSGNAAGMFGLEDASEYIESFDIGANNPKLSSGSLHGDYLRLRYSTGQPLAELLSASEFRAGDLLIYFWNFFVDGRGENYRWTPWSSKWVSDEYPIFLIEATVRRKAQPLSDLLGSIRVEELGERLKKASKALGRMWTPSVGNPLMRFDFDSIAKK